MTRPAPDLFAVLGLPRRYHLDRDELERRFHERARLLHPDRFVRATPRERRIALERATQLNDAYRTLQEPRRRAACLLSLLDPAAAPPSAAPGFLEEQLAVREELAGARATGNRAAVAQIADRARAALAAIDAELVACFAEEDVAAGSLAAVGAALARARYHEAVLAEADSAPAPGPAR